MTDDKEIIITFASTHDVMSAEKKLKEQKYKIELIPVPREISSECGFCLKIYKFNQKEIIEKLDYENIWEITTNPRGRKTYDKRM